MSSADSRSGRIRRREEEGDAAQQAAQGVEAEPNNQPAGATMTAGPSPADLSAAAAPLQPPSLSVQPLPEQFSQRKRPRRSARLACHLDKLAVVELQLFLQFLDTKSKLIAARCSRRLLHAASAPFAWRSTPPFTVEAPSDADVERIGSSLLRFVPIHLRCDWLKSLQCLATVPHLVDLDLLNSARGVAAAAEFSRLLQHPNLARLQLLRLDADTSSRLTVDTMVLIARLPQLRTFDAVVRGETSGAVLLQPLAAAPALTDLTVRREFAVKVGAALLAAVSGCAGLRNLSLHRLLFSTGLFLALCSSPNMHQLQHLELVGVSAGSAHNGAGEPPDADEYRAAFSALQQLQSLTLQEVWSVNTLLAYLHHVPALRLLCIRCLPYPYPHTDTAYFPLPSRAALSALLTVSPRLEVQLCLAATLDRWLAQRRPADVAHYRAVFEQQWCELKRMTAEMDRVTDADWEPSDA